METLWQILYWVLGLVLVAMVILKIYVESIKGKCTSKADLTGKTVIVTGANTGIGFWTAMDLARRNARVILACRDINKGGEAAKKIEAATGNDNITVRKVDLSLMKSVREFAAEILAEESRLDILINNGGLAGIPLTMTEEGLETMMATNHFGPFLLTNLLLDLLKKSGSSRIVTVTSIAHKWCRGLDFDNLSAEKSYDIAQFYFVSKLANILFTRELAHRLEGTGVVTSSVHPGAVASDIWRILPTPHACVLGIPKFIYFKTPEEGAQTSIYCAVSEDLEGSSGKYFMDCKEVDAQSSELSRDMGTAKKLWEVSERITGLA